MALPAPVSETPSVPGSSVVCSLEIGTDPLDSSPSKVSILSKLQGIVAVKGKVRCLLLILSIFSMAIGFTAGALLSRFYFEKGGSRKWLSTWLQSSGWPVLALATVIVYRQHGLKPTPLNAGLASSYVFLGVFVGFTNFLYAWGISCLPASTNALLSSSQLAFNAIFAMLITRQKISAFGWNSIVLITSSAVILALHSESDKLPGVSRQEYIIEYIVTIAAAALYGLLYPLTEMVLRKYLTGRSNVVVLEMQVCYCIIATIVATMGMLVNRDFQAIPRESGSFRAGGLSGYCLNLVLTAVSWQVGSLGSVGVVFLSSSLLAGVVLSAAIPLISILAVVFFHDSFGGLKVMSMLLSLWGFVSYIYGGYLDTRARSPKVAGTISS